MREPPLTHQDLTSIEFKLVVEELEDLVKIVVVSALLLMLSSSIWMPIVGTDKNSILRKSLGFGIPDGGLIRAQCSKIGKN